MPTVDRGPESASTSSQPNVHRVYLTEEWYLNVDDDGYLVGPCAEGALGYVLQLQSADHADTQADHLALKVPRLRADTIEENAHIVRTLVDEARAVRDANRIDQKRLSHERDDQHAVEGLIGTAVTKGDKFLRGPRSLANAGIDAESLPQHQCIPFLSFGKDHRLRFCSVRYEFPLNDKPKLIAFPNTPSVMEALAFLTPKLWKKYFQGLRPSGLESTLYFEVAPLSLEAASIGELATGPNSEEVSGEQATVNHVHYRTHGQLDSALALQQPMVTWYSGIPSIVFKWSSGTLQRAISTNEHKRWVLKDHYALVRQVLRGLRTLHRAGIIHADVRPANIMVLGSFSNPEHFHLSDYGSFANDQAGGGNGGGHTTAPGVVRHRTSVFYSRERRAGIEREDADIAIIIGNTGAARDFSPGYYVRLGWKAELVEPTRGEVKDSVLEDMVQCWRHLDKLQRNSEGARTADGQAQAFSGTAWSLAQGDLFRVRDYVFRICAIPTPSIPVPMGDLPGAPQPTRCNDFLCDPTYTCVLLEKLSVRSGRDLFDEIRKKEATASGAPDRLPAVILLDLPRWIEIRQSSVASDIYSVGVTALYSVYTAALHRKRVHGRPNEDTRSSQDAPIDIEERVATMLRRLEDEANFNQLWSELDHVCHWIELGVETPIPIAQLLQQDVSPQASAENSPLAFGEVARNLLQTIVGLSSELDAIALHGCQNYGHFLLFIHFVLSCIHRKSHRSANQTHGEVRAEFPFCNDRFERETKDQVASAILQRLDKLNGYFQHPSKFKELHKYLEGADFTAARQSDYQLRQTVHELRKEKENLISERDKYKQLAQDAKRQETAANKQLQECLSGLRDQRNKDSAEKEILQGELKCMAGELERMAGELETEKQLYTRLQQDLGKSLPIILRLLKELEGVGQGVTFGRRLDDAMLDRIRQGIGLLAALGIEPITIRTLK